MLTFLSIVGWISEAPSTNAQLRHRRHLPRRVRDCGAVFTALCAFLIVQNDAHAEEKSKFTDDVYSAATAKLDPIESPKNKLHFIENFLRINSVEEIIAIKDKIKATPFCSEATSTKPLNERAESVLKAVACGSTSPQSPSNRTIESVTYNFYSAGIVLHYYHPHSSAEGLAAALSINLHFESYCPNPSSLGDAMKPGWVTFSVDRPPPIPPGTSGPGFTFEQRWTDIKLAPINYKSSVMTMTETNWNGKIDCSIFLQADTE